MTHPITTSLENSRRRWWVGGTVLTLALFILGGWLFTRLHRPPAAVELPVAARTNLWFSEGRWYQLPETNAFTGWLVEHYPDNSLCSRVAVSNGLLNGVSEGWFTNGQIRIREYYKDSLAEGLRQKWHPNGQLKSEANIVQGKLEGTFRSWHENGQLAETMEMRQGYPEGEAWAYYDSGFVKAETQVREGQVLAQQSWQDGERQQARRDGSPNSRTN